MRSSELTVADAIRLLEKCDPKLKMCAIVKGESRILGLGNHEIKANGYTADENNGLGVFTIKKHKNNELYICVGNPTTYDTDYKLVNEITDYSEQHFNTLTVKYAMYERMCRTPSIDDCLDETVMRDDFWKRLSYSGLGYTYRKRLLVDGILYLKPLEERVMLPQNMYATIRNGKVERYVERVEKDDYLIHTPDTIKVFRLYDVAGDYNTPKSCLDNIERSYTQLKAIEDASIIFKAKSLDSGMNFEQEDIKYFENKMMSQLRTSIERLITK